MTIFIVETIYSRIYFHVLHQDRRSIIFLISTDHNEDLYVVHNPSKFQLNRTTINHSPKLLIEDRRKTLKYEASIKKGQKLPFNLHLTSGQQLKWYCSLRSFRSSQVCPGVDHSILTIHVETCVRHPFD
jgi:hypothetical protein